MATIKDLVNEYYIRIFHASDKDQEIKKVIDEINLLEYSDTKIKISDEHKCSILEELEKKLKQILIKQFDNKEYLQLISAAISYLKSNKK